MPAITTTTCIIPLRGLPRTSPPLRHHKMERREHYDYAEGGQRCAFIPRTERLIYPSSYTHPTPGIPTLFNTAYLDVPCPHTTTSSVPLSFPHYTPLFNPTSMSEYPQHPPPQAQSLPTSLALYSGISSSHVHSYSYSPTSYSSVNSPASAPDFDYVEELDLEMVQCFYPEVIHSPTTSTTSPGTSVPPGIIPSAAHTTHVQSSSSSASTTTSRSSLQTAADVIIFQCDHPGCKRSYRRLCDLRKHKKRHQKPFPCRHAAAKGCRSFFSTEKDRDRHERSKHRREEHLACIVCGHRTARKDNMKDHVRRRHSEKDLEEIMAMIVTGGGGGGGNMNNVPGPS
jgi:hypothetical protein